MTSSMPRPIVVPNVRVIERRRDHEHEPPRSRQRKREAEILETLSVRPAGPFEMADEQGRRLVSEFQAYYVVAIQALRAMGAIELVDLPCLCGRRGSVTERCSCPHTAYRLARKPPPRVVIYAAERFRPSGRAA